MSDTPRTDDCALRDYVHADFARQLERELNAATAENAEMKTVIYEFCKEQSWACNEWKTQTHIAPLFKLAEQHVK